jgi:hypothetical protein
MVPEIIAADPNPIENIGRRPGHRRTYRRRVAAIALRPAVPADLDFCFGLHRAGMGDYIAAIWGWDEQVQRGFHAVNRRAQALYRRLGLTEVLGDHGDPLRIRMRSAPPGGEPGPRLPSQLWTSLRMLPRQRTAPGCVV